MAPRWSRRRVELLERYVNAALDEEGAFTVKTIKGHRYWHFQTGAGDARTQRYACAETPDLLERTAGHKEARDDERERRALVSTLVQSFNCRVPSRKPAQLMTMRGTPSLATVASKAARTDIGSETSHGWAIIASPHALPSLGPSRSRITTRAPLSTNNAAVA